MIQAEILRRIWRPCTDKRSSLLGGILTLAVLDHLHGRTSAHVAHATTVSAVDRYRQRSLLAVAVYFILEGQGKTKTAELPTVASDKAAGVLHLGRDQEKAKWVTVGGSGRIGWDLVGGRLSWTVATGGVWCGGMRRASWPFWRNSTGRRLLTLLLTLSSLSSPAFQPFFFGLPPPPLALAPDFALLIGRRCDGRHGANLATLSRWLTSLSGPTISSHSVAPLSARDIGIQWLAPRG